MFWSYDSRTYSDCGPCTVLSVLLHVKYFKAVYSVETKTKVNLRRMHFLTYWHQCNHRFKRRLMHEIEALPLNVNHTAVYANNVIASNGPTIHMGAKSDNTAMNTDMMVI